MLITVDVPQELEAQVRERAALRGSSVEQYLIALAAQDTARSDDNPAPAAQPGKLSEALAAVLRNITPGYRPTAEEQEQAFQELLQGIHTGVALTDEELRRENLYEDPV